MPNLGKVLKDEMTRLSRKECRQQTTGLRTASAAHRRQIAQLRRSVADLQREIATLRRAKARIAEPATEPSSMRFVAKGLRTLRARLDLSASDFGQLAGVSGQTIYNWERGKSVPRKSQLAVLGQLRSLGKREAGARLLQLKSSQTRRASKKKAAGA